MSSRDLPTAVAYCPHCGNRAPQELVGSYSTSVRAPGERINYTLTACQTCECVLLYRMGARKELSAHQLLHAPFTLDGRELVWPDPGTLRSSVPSAVRACYEEAAVIKSRAPNAFANSIRRALEALCKDRKTTKQTLAESLRELSDRGELNPVLSQMSDLIRMIGNIGSHADDLGVQPAYVEAIDEFFRAVVEYVYVAPQRVNEVKAQMDYARKVGKPKK